MAAEESQDPLDLPGLGAKVEEVENKAKALTGSINDLKAFHQEQMGKLKAKEAEEESDEDMKEVAQPYISPMPQSVSWMDQFEEQKRFELWGKMYRKGNTKKNVKEIREEVEAEEVEVEEEEIREYISSLPDRTIKFTDKDSKSSADVPYKELRKKKSILSVLKIVKQHLGLENDYYYTYKDGQTGRSLSNKNCDWIHVFALTEVIIKKIDIKTDLAKFFLSPLTGGDVEATAKQIDELIANLAYATNMAPGNLKNKLHKAREIIWNKWRVKSLAPSEATQFWAPVIEKMQDSSIDQALDQVCRMARNQGVLSLNISEDQLDIELQKLGEFFSLNKFLIEKNMDYNDFLRALSNNIFFCEESKIEECLEYSASFHGQFAFAHMQYKEFAEGLRVYCFQSAFKNPKMVQLQEDVLGEQIANVFIQHGKIAENDWSALSNVSLIAEGIRKSWIAQGEKINSHLTLKLVCDLKNLNPENARLLKNKVPYVEQKSPNHTQLLKQGLEDLIGTVEDEKHVNFLKQTGALVDLSLVYVEDDRPSGSTTMMIRTGLEEFNIANHGFMITVYSNVPYDPNLKTKYRKYLSGAHSIACAHLVQYAYGLEWYGSEWTRWAMTFYIWHMNYFCLCLNPDYTTNENEEQYISGIPLPKHLWKPWIGHYPSCLLVTIVSTKKKLPPTYLKHLEEFEYCANVILCTEGGIFTKEDLVNHSCQRKKVIKKAIKWNLRKRGNN